MSAFFALAFANTIPQHRAEIAKALVEEPEYIPSTKGYIGFIVSRFVLS